MGMSMAKLIVGTRDGTEHEIEGDTSLTVMEIIRDAGRDEMLALCGGCCWSATWHVHVEPGEAGGVHAVREEENELADENSERGEKAGPRKEEREVGEGMGSE